MVSISTYFLHKQTNSHTHKPYKNLLKYNIVLVGVILNNLEEDKIITL